MSPEPLHFVLKARMEDLTIEPTRQGVEKISHALKKSYDRDEKLGNAPGQTMTNDCMSGPQFMPAFGVSCLSARFAVT